MTFNVPYYAQSSEFTCGPACVLMVMKHFDPAVEIGRELEFEVWRQCNMIGIKGADPFGLAVPLIDAGYKVRLITRRRQIVNYDRWRRRLLRNSFSSEEIDLSMFGMKENRERAARRKLAVEYKRPVVADILRGIRDRYVPIALVHMGVIHSLNIPHWIVITDANETAVVFNDPYPPKGRKGLRLTHVKFQKILDDIGTKIGLSPSVLFVKKR
jgi:hypothetical protein